MNFGQSYVQRKYWNFRAKTQSSGYREELRLRWPVRTRVETAAASRINEPIKVKSAR